MKKILSALIALTLTLCVSVTTFAASSSVSVKNNDSGSKPVTYTYAPNKSGENVKSIKTLMTKLNDLPKKSSVVQTLTITSESMDNTPVSFKLRLSLPEKATATIKPEVIKTPSPDEYSALEYYNIKITDASDNIIYSYENEKSESGKTTYKDIPIGILNKTMEAENKIINITVSVNKDVKTSSVEKYANKLDWSIVSDTDFEVESTPTPVPTIVVTATPEIILPNTTVIPTIAPTIAPSITPTATSSVKEDKNGVVTLSKGEYLCGKDIDAGRYTMTGDGKVHVYTSEGVLKSTIALKNKKSSANGVEEYVINLLEGEKISVESDTEFEPYTAERATSKPTSTPKATSKTSTNSAKATSTPAATKSNPKTGDTAPILGIVCLGVAAVGAFVFFEIKKRKENQ